MLGEVATTVTALVNNISRVVRGKEEEIRRAVSCLLIEGHLLLDDVPGTGKTSLARAISESINGDWKRVQFTPDLLPSDITGVMVFDQSTGVFNFRPGPVFTNVLIGDEINRGSPKTQSALLEVMEERQVTTDGRSRAVPRPFFVIATQNPRDFQGTFPLPDVQLDRFAMRLTLGYADPNTEARVLADFHRTQRDQPLAAVVDAEQLESVIDAVDRTPVAPSIDEYIVQIANATREHPDLRLGISTRGSITLMRAAKAWAATEEREHVEPADVQAVALAVCSHRVSLTPEADLQGMNTDDIVASIVESIPVPRQRSAV